MYGRMLGRGAAYVQMNTSWRAPTGEKAKSFVAGKHGDDGRSCRRYFMQTKRGDVADNHMVIQLLVVKE